MTTGGLRQNVFICYSHADTKYLKLFELKLQPAVGDKLSVWSDQKIAAGADWHSEIERQLHAATAALLLVSDTFLSSSYIRTVELPTILERHAKEGLALALDEYHRRRVVYGPLTANDVFYDQERNLLRISAVGLSSYLAVKDPISGGFPRGPVAASYMVPEQYTGAMYGPRSDQYSLGLIAFEMLEGKQPVCPACPADLEVKRKFFQNPESFAGEWERRHPPLASIVFRMLAEDPDERWDLCG